MLIGNSILLRIKIALIEQKKKMNKQLKRILVFLVALFFVSPTTAWAIIIPTPQISTYDSSQELLIDSSWQIIYDQSLKYIDNTINVLDETLNNNLGAYLEIKEKEQFIAGHTSISNHENANIFLMLYNDFLIEEYFIFQGSQIHDYSVHIGDKGFNQGYLLFSYNGSIYILANSSQGIYYGVQSFKQIIETQQSPIDGFNIIDWPDIENRIYYYVGHEDSTDVSDPTIGLDLLNDLAKYKMNGAQLSSGSMMSHMDNMFIPYVDYCIRNFINPILAHSWPRNIEKGTEGFFVEDEPFTFNENDIAVADNSSDNILFNLGFEDGVVGSTPDNWYVASDSWLVTDQEYYSGSKALTLSRDSSSGSLQPMISQVGNIQPNSGHLATFKVKTEGSSGTGHYQFILYNQDASDNNIFYRENNYVPIDDGEWHTLYVHISKHSDARKIKLWIRPRNIYGTIYVDDIKLYRMNSELSNVLLQDEHIFQVTNQDGTTEYLKDVDYSVEKIGPDLTTVSHIKELTNKVTVERISSGSIGVNENILVSYDYIFYQDKSTLKNLNPFVNYTYDLIKDYMVGLADEFNNYGISSDEFDVFFGQDEIRGFNMDSRSVQAGKENYEAMAMNFNKLYNLAKEVFPNSEVFFWADMLNLYHNGGDENYQIVWGGKSGTTYQASHLIDKSIILIPWQYSINDIIENSVRFFNDVAGIKIAGGAGGSIDNIKYWSAASKDNYFYGHSIFQAEYPKKEIIKYFANYSWNNYKPVVPTNLQIIATTTSQTDLMWGESTSDVGLLGYKIYRDSIFMTNTTNTTYQDTDLSPSTPYTYTVSAYDVFNNESQQSDPVFTAIQQQIICGDSICSTNETCSSCAQDCGECEQEEEVPLSSVGGGSAPGTIDPWGTVPETQILATTTATTTQEIIIEETITTQETSTTTPTTIMATTTIQGLPLDNLEALPPNKRFTKTLRFGIQNEEVKQLQEYLSTDEELYPEGLITGYYGQLTTKATQRFQCKHNIVCAGTPNTTGYGLVGPLTREKLNEIFKETGDNQESKQEIDQILDNNEQIIQTIQSQIRQLRQQVINLLLEISKMLQTRLSD